MEGEVWLQMLFLLGPAGIANTAPVFGSKIAGLKKWQTPLDFGISYRQQRLLGDHKTWRGLALGVLAGGLVGLLQIYLIEHVPAFANVALETGHLNLILLGCLLGLAALVGDAGKSFFKRRFGIQPGQPWYVMDQIDYILGAYIVISLLFDLTPTHYVVGLIMYGMIHPVVSYTAYLLKLKRDRF